MTAELDWPVPHGGVAVVGPEGVQERWVAGGRPASGGSTPTRASGSFGAIVAGAITTMPDLVRLARCLLDQGTPVLGEELFAEATTVQFPGLAGLAAAAVTDRDFDDERWAMATWPAWSDGLP